MKIYLVDFENVKSKGLTGIDNLTETDSVIIFYSENSDTISFEMHQKVLTSKAEIEYFKVNVGGKNALDFQLSTLLGYLVAKDMYTNIFIISNDRGFDFLHDFWHGKYVDTPNTTVYRTRTIQAAINFSGDKNSILIEEQTDSAEAAVDTNISEQEIHSDISSETESCLAEGETEIESFDDSIMDSIDENLEQSEIVSASDTEEQIALPEACAPDLPSVNIDAEKESDFSLRTQKETENKHSRQKNNKRPVGYMDNLRTILGGVCTDEQIETISGLLISSDTKEELHNALAKIYKQQATEFYKILRPRYLRLKNLYSKENSTAKTETVPFSESISTESYDDETVIYHDVLSLKLAELLSSKCSEDELERIRKCVFEANTKQQLYIRMVKEFRKKKGCEFYNMIRSEYSSLHKIVQESES